eukprot:1191518-Prorocentrum_minimum.AAC.3
MTECADSQRPRTIRLAPRYRDSHPQHTTSGATQWGRECVRHTVCHKSCSFEQTPVLKPLTKEIYIVWVHIDSICPLPSPDWSTSTEYAPSSHPIGRKCDRTMAT